MHENETRRASKSNSGLTRRQAVAAALAGVAAPFVIGRANAQSAAQIIYAGGGGAYVDALDAAFFKPFTQDTGIKVQNTANVDLAKLKAQIMTNNVEVDIMDIISTEIVAGTRQNLLEPIDYSVVKVDRSDILYPDAVQSHSLGLFTYTSGIAFDTKRTPEGKRPNNWKEFWDVKNFPGRRGLRSRPNETLEIALLASGVAPKDMYPLNVDAAFKSLDVIKPHVRKWIDTTPQTIELLTSNEVDFVNTFNGRVLGATNAGYPAGFSTDQLLIELGCVAIPKGSKHLKEATMLLASMQKPERLAKFGELMAYPPISKKAAALLSPAMKQWVPDLSTNQHLLVNNDWWGEPGRLSDLNARFRTWLLS